MAERNDSPKSSLRNNIMIAFVLGVVLFGGAITAISHRVLDRALAKSGLPIESSESIGQQFMQTLTGFTMAGTALALLLAALLSRTITEPIQRLLAGVKEISDGNLDEHVEVSGDDELGSLAEAFNDMAHRLKQSHDDLESTVAERTAELTDANQKLQTEITERWRAEAALRAGERRLQNILDSIVAGVLIIDPENHIVLDINESAARQVGLPKAEIVGKLCHEFVCPAERGKCPITDLDQVVDQSECLLLRADGTTVPIIKSITSATFQGHECLIESFVEITEQKKAQQEQDALLHRVAAINEELSHFAYVVSHDLKAPLRGIKLIAEWLCADYGDKLGNEATEQLALLTNRVERMHSLIEGVLQYSRVGRVKENLTRVDLNELVTNVTDLIAPPEHVDVVVEGSLPEVTCEKTRMTQVFQNLISNAVKYMDKPKGRVVIGCSEDDAMWTFHVSDNGPGIEEKYFDRIFKIFQTLTARDQFESTGVGLTLVKKIVELYDGKVWVKSELGQGSTFCFTFPKRHAEIQETPAAVGTASGSVDC